MDFLAAAVGFGHRRIDHFGLHWRDVQASAIAFDERDDRLVRHIQGEVGIGSDLLPKLGHFDVLVRGDGSTRCAWIGE